jgi:hypothetical protein
MRIACWIPKAADTPSLGNTHCFSIARMVGRTRLIVTLYVHCLSCSVSAVHVQKRVEAAAGRVGSFPERSQIFVHTGSANPFSLSSGYRR